MSKNKLFVVITVAVVAVSVMISYKKISENQIEDAFLRNSNAYFACTF